MILVNDLWCQHFLHTFVTHRSLIGSDHRPLLISIAASDPPSSPPPFRYLNMWYDHPSFFNIVTDAWYTSMILDPWSKLVYFHLKVSKALNDWGWSSFGNVFPTVESAENEVLELEKTVLADGGEETLLLDAQKKLITIDMEDKFLKQKATISHFKEGDRNTKFYHACIKYKRRCNTIHNLQNFEGI
ncbi:uncharacterized protein LOC110038338 [Phalaenopsis equestris]|uniref:uncharacterized protein LOC110038338 n=1 Tax=Phalaenopsis equestris TaxID=78828 RepID=UPI0009E41784|nr:uncharacterized protein LOC110038338 [Phalaenopsis equestris]